MTTREKIIALARDCNVKSLKPRGPSGGIYELTGKAIEAFYHAVRNQALEDAAKLSVDWGNARQNAHGGDACRNLAEAIRQMKEEIK